jgi:hypothetical protein
VVVVFVRILAGGEGEQKRERKQDCVLHFLKNFDCERCLFEG